MGWWVMEVPLPSLLELARFTFKLEESSLQGTMKPFFETLGFVGLDW